MILKAMTLAHHATIPECQKNVAVVTPIVFSVYLCQIVTISHPPTLHSANE